MPAPSVELQLPSVLVLGGILEGTASAVLAHLWPSSSSKHRKAGYIRIADKFLILPQSDTFLRWIHPDARKILTDAFGGGVEYMQANIVGESASLVDGLPYNLSSRSSLPQAVAESRSKVFQAPNGKAFDIVFDFTAGSVTSGSTEEIMVQTAAMQGKLLGLEALKYGGVGAYVRMVDPFVTQPRKKCPLREDDINAKPTSLWSKWHWEGSRALAGLEDLNLILARIANPWGPGCLIGLTRRLTVASVYAYLGPSETLEFLWGKDLVLEHIHVMDIASSFFALAQWMRLDAKTRDRANELAGEFLPPCRPAALPKEEENKGQAGQTLKFDDVEIEGLVKREEMVKAPLFNVTDGSAQTQEDIGKVIERAFGIKVDYYSAITNALAKMNMNEVVEAADEQHTEPWLEMLSASKPPILNTPLSPALPPTILRKNRCHLDGTKIRTIVGWKPAYPKVTVDEVKACVALWKKDGIWPNVKPKKT